MDLTSFLTGVFVTTTVILVGLLIYGVKLQNKKKGE